MDSSSKEGKPLILIVDDIPKNLQILGSMLSKEGYQIAAALESVQALEMIQDITPDLILLDIMMPGLDGLELCRKLKDSGETEEIPVIFITAKTEKEDIVRGFEAGAVDYITKPFNATELIARVNTHIKLKQALDYQKKLVDDLTGALNQVKQLSGLLPICSHCKKIRDDNGYWKQVEDYVMTHSEASFSHSICPDCLDKHYPQYAEKVKNNKSE